MRRSPDVTVAGRIENGRFRLGEPGRWLIFPFGAAGFRALIRRAAALVSARRHSPPPQMGFPEPSASSRAAARGALLLAALVLWLPAVAQAQTPAEITLVSSIGRFSALFDFREEDHAQGFRTGMTPDGYVLSSLELVMRSLNSATMSNLTVTLRNASGNDPGSMVLGTFVNPDPPALSTTQQTFRFTLPGGEELDPDTRYFIHLKNNHPSGSIEVAMTLSDDQDPGGLDDWGIDDDAIRQGSGGWVALGGGFTPAISIQLDGYAKPPPTGRILVSNTGQTQGSPVSFRSLDAAQGFETGMTPAGYVLSALELILEQGGSGVAMSNLTVTLRNASGTDPGSMTLATFMNPDSPALSTALQTFRFTLSEGVELDPDTRYFIHLKNNHASRTINASLTTSDNQDPDGLGDWGIDDGGKRLVSSAWQDFDPSDAIQIQLDGYAKPSPPQNSNNALEYLNIDDVSLFRHSFSGVERYVGLSGILSITSTVTLRFKLDDPTATCEVKQSSLDLTNTDANLASATTVLASSSCSSSAENVLAVNLPVGNNDLAVLVTAEDGDIQKHGVALARPSAPNAELLEGQATGWIIDFGPTIGSGGGDVHIRTWGDATPGGDYELFRQTGTSPSPTYVKLDALNNYATPMPSDGRVTIILNAVDNPFEENREHVQIALYPATSGIPEHPVEAAILDNDVAVTFGAATYMAAEGGTVAVTVNLSRDLGRDFEIQLTATGQNGATPADFEIPANVAITAGQTSATFTVTIVDDAIAESGESVALSFTGAANNGVEIQAGNIFTATVSIEGDFDTGEVVVSETELAIAEGESEVYTVSLGSQPTGAVTVTVAGHSGTDLTVSPTELIFTDSSWGPQTVTVTANPDLVQTSYVATLTHMVAGADYGANNVMAESVTVRVMNFTGGVAVSPTELAIDEGGSEVYTVSLESQPTGAVTVTVAGHSGTDLTVSPTELIFTDSSWGSQTITVTANPDLVQNDYVETLTHMVAGAGYGANNVMAESVTVRVMNFTGGVAVSLTELAVGEGESEVYTVSLESQPTGAVTVTVAGHSGTDLTVSPAELIFTGSSWGAQTVTVTANPDLVQTSYVATLMHMVAGADYGANNVTAESVTVRVMNFTGGVGVSPTELAIAEGESEVYTVSLRSQPTGAVTVTVAGHSGTDLTVSSAELIFTSSSWSPQTVTVTANPDLVPTDYVATLTHVVASADYGTNNVTAESVTVRVMNFTGGVAVSPTELAIAEGESEVYTVSLESQPTGAVTVTVAGHSGTDLTVLPTELIFTGSSWGAQTITVTANPDLVQNDYVETLTHMVGGANYGANSAMAESVTVRVMNFTGGVAVSETGLEIAEGESEVYTVSLGSQPTGAVTVTVAGHSGTDLTVSPTALTFTSSSWGPQTVTVTANLDFELTDYVATLTHMVGGANYGANNVMAGSVTVTVMDDQVVRLPIPEDGRVEVPIDSEMLAGTVVKLSLSEPEKYLLIFKEVALEGLTDTDFPPGFMTVEGAVIVDITLVNAVTMIEVPLESPATVCLPTDRTGLRMYHYDADEDSPMWMALPLPSDDESEGLACGVTESFSWFALGTSPSDAAEAWLARFGRTVATHVVEAVSSRLATSTPQQEVTLGGVAPQSALLSGALQTLSDGTAPDARALLSGSSFVLPLSGTGGARWTAWGRGAYTEFDGQEDGTSLDGEVLTSTIGLDWARDRWLAGIAVSHSEGDGDIRAESSSEEIDVSLTGAHPYLRYETEQGISIWGLLGWGEGDLERERDGVSSEVDLEMQMGALGARGRIASYKGFDLSLKSDALAVRLEADADAEEERSRTECGREPGAGAAGRRGALSPEVGEVRWCRSWKPDCAGTRATRKPASAWNWARGCAIRMLEAD